MAAATVPAAASRSMPAAALTCLAYVLVAAPFLVATIRETMRHWSAVADDGAIAIRSFDSFSRHGQLVGQFSQVTANASHGTYDPGPLQYWLLAIPVHLDPRYGLLWGSALWCVVAAMIAVAAARSVLGAAGAVAAACVVVANLAWTPQILLDPAWNPHFGEIFFLATIATTWAVLCGNRVWLPVAVFTASVAAQAHLMFSLACIAFAAVALVWAGVEAHRAKTRHLWLLVALCLGLASWVGPLVQELTAHPGNLTLLFRSQSTQPRMGLKFGIKFLAAVTFPHPIWWRPTEGLTFFPILNAVGNGAQGVGVAVIALAAVVSAAAFRLHERRLGALGIMSVVLSLALVATFANIPSGKLLTVGYLIVIAFPAGAVAWVTVCWAVALGALRLWRLRGADRRRHRHGGDGLGVIAPMMATAAVVVSVLAQSQLAEVLPTYPPWSSMQTAQVAARLIEKSYPRGTFDLVVNNHGGGGLYTYDDTLGIAWALKAAGFTPRVGGPMESAIGRDYGAAPGTSILVVNVSPGGVTVNEDGGRKTE
jgi:hypothetical protein